VHSEALLAEPSSARDSRVGARADSFERNWSTLGKCGHGLEVD
jgi:hypothetical protein